MQSPAIGPRDSRRLRGAATGGGAASGASQTGAQTAASGVRSGSSFQEILEEVMPAQRSETRDLKQLWSELPEAERQLIEKQSDENLQRYKQLVAAIARETLRRNTRIRKIRRRSRSGDEVELSIVEFVDERLQRMANLIHSRGNSAFQILKAVEEIRGILIDVRE
ncbi:MAG: YaaR family protein [Leptospirales bacterium]|nr:YaaR family protein [Leptospirales bacterium]